jgi:protein disulfide-isomerase
MKAFVNVKVVAGSDLAESLGERYRVRGYPTLLVVDAEGAEIDRIVGYGGVPRFTAEVERIRKGERTLPALRAKHQAAPDDPAAALAYAVRLVRSSPADAIGLLEKVSEALKGKDRETETGAWLALAEARAESGDVAKALAAYERVLDERGDTEAAKGGVAKAAMLFYRDDVDAETGLAFLAKAKKALSADAAGRFDDLSVRLHRRAAEAALRRMADRVKDDPETLNFVAWEAYQARLAMDDAVGWARTAVEGSKRKPEILDTLAHLLFESGEVDEAVTLEKEALGKVEDESMKKEFEEAVARFEAVARVRKERELRGKAGDYPKENESSR